MKGPIRDEDVEASLLSSLILIYYFLGSGRQYGCFNSDNIFRHFLGKTAKNCRLQGDVCYDSIKEDISCLNSEYEIFNNDLMIIKSLSPCFGPTFLINESVKLNVEDRRKTVSTNNSDESN